MEYISSAGQRSVPRPAAVAAGRSDAGRHAASGSVERPASTAVAAPSRLAVSVVALSAAAGLLIAAAAYTAGRLGPAVSPWANGVYWVGQALIVVPVAVRFVGRRLLTERDSIILVVILTVAEYLVKVCYSPNQFSFSDELAHWRSTVNLLNSGKLSTPNYMLPISPKYPGLEEATVAFKSATGLSIFVSGLVIAGIAHLIFVFTLYVVFRQVGRSHRVAGIAVLLYSSNPDLAFFDSMFVYQTLAMAFFALALLATWRMGLRQSLGQQLGWLTVAVVEIAATVVTHHVTSYMLAAMLMLFWLATLATRHGLAAKWLGAAALISVGMIVLWVAFVAPETVGYLGPPADGILQGLSAFFGGAHQQGAAAPGGPLADRALAAADFLLLSSLVPVGWFRVRQRYPRQPWVRGMAVGALGWYALVAIRFVSANGSELAGRAATFVFIPVAFIAALGLIQLVGAGVRRWQSWVPATAALLGALVLLFDGLANGWPPYWERIPGKHQVAGFEQSVDPQGIAAAQWTLSALGPGHRFGVDFGNATMLGSYGNQTALLGVASLYTSPRYTGEDVALVQTLAVRYLLVDRRLSESLPASGQYFETVGDVTHPLSLTGLTKFSTVPGLARIYDSGDIVIYDLGG